MGVVGTAHYVSLRDEAEPQLFFPMLTDAHPRSFIVYVRSMGLGTFAAAGALIPAMRAARINPLNALREE